MTLADELGLTKYLDRKFYALSTGYRQRASIARAFINDPRVVFLDEPTIGLDVMTARSIREFLRAQAKQSGRTVMLASHNMAEVEAICDRVAIVDEGRIIASGSPDSLKRSLGASALVLEVQPAPKSLGILEGVVGVKGSTSTVDGERDQATVHVVVGSDSAAEGAQERFEAAGYRVLSSWRKPATLEEVFVALVGEGFKEREEENGG
jgi:ABC-2 type transport system ATP-binding protein